MKYITILPLLLWFAACSLQKDTTPLSQQDLKRCALAGIKDSVLCGSYAVPENRDVSFGRMINLKVIVIPALNKDSLLPPIFIIDGGPGAAATSSVDFYADPLNPYRLRHDIVMMDARGTGGSHPLHCLSLQHKNNLQDQMKEMYPAAAVKSCYDSLSKLADLTQYTTTRIVEDIDAVRKWLGYDKINLFGLSYGTRVSLVYMKMFPSAVESAILWSPAPTYARMPVYHATFAQQTMNKLFEDCRGDSACAANYPELQAEFDDLKNKMSREPVQWQRGTNGTGERISIPWYAFQTKIRGLTYHPQGLRRVPYIIHEAALGNMEPFLSLFPDGPDTDYFLAEGMYLCVTCAEDVPLIRDDEIDSLTKGTFMGTYRIDQQRTACKNWVRAKIPGDFLQPVISDIPTLIYSGGFDPVTPPSMAKEIASHLSKSIIVSIPGMSHTYFGLNHPECFDNIAAEFLKNPAHTQPFTACIAQMTPEAYKVK